MPKRPPPRDWTRDENLNKVRPVDSLDKDWPADHEVEQPDRSLRPDA